MGWKIGLWGGGYWLGIASWTIAVRTDSWISIFKKTNPANNGSESIPDSNAGISLGGGTGKEVWFGRDFRLISGGANLLKLNASILPESDNSYDLGNNSYRWRYAYIKKSFINESVRIGGTVISKYDLDIDVPIIPDDLLGFTEPFKVEAWDNNASSWVDVTSSCNWKLLHDQDNTNGIDLRDVGWYDDATGKYYARIRLYYNFGGRWKVPAVYLVINFQHANTITYIKIEQADDADITTNVDTRLEWSGNLTASDRTIIAKLNNSIWRQYVRIEIHVEGTSDLTIRSIHLLGLSFWGGSKLIKHWIPLDWTVDKQIKFLNHALPNTDNAYDLGSTTQRWRNAYIGGTLHVYGGANFNNTAITGVNHIEINDIGIGEGLVFQSGSIDISVWTNDQGGEDAFVFRTTSTYPFKFKIDGADKLEISDSVKVGLNLVPSSDSTYDLGGSSLRWNNIYAVNIYASNVVQVGDLLFKNGWRFIEDEKHGIVLIDPNGKKYKMKLEEVK